MTRITTPCAANIAEKMFERAGEIRRVAMDNALETKNNKLRSYFMTIHAEYKGYQHACRTMMRIMANNAPEIVFPIW